MAKCGTCNYFSKCGVADERDDSCSCYYPDFYMEVFHPKEWREYEKSLEEER